jgi:hypothetical protein
MLHHAERIPGHPLSILLRGKKEMNADRAQRENGKNQITSFGAHAAARHPICPMKRGAEEVTFREQTAIRRAIKICFRPIPRRVKTDRKPQVARAPQCKRSHKAKRAGRDGAENRFA